MKIKGTNSSIKFGSKADTLLQLNKYNLLCKIPQFKTFSLNEWMQTSNTILEEIAQVFKSNLVAVRSSATCEDGPNRSNAGAFRSFLNIVPTKCNELKKAIEQVFASYPVYNENDQVIIQKMVENIIVSGVILTRCVDDGSPYYVINYDDETRQSDFITGGKGIHKTIMVYRKFKPNYCDSSRVRRMLEFAQEIEGICAKVPLDIEFAIDDKGFIHLLQVRQISTVSSWHPDTENRVSRIIPNIELFVEQLSVRKKGIYGNYSVYGNMPDWNPAELIGVIPTPLAASLFRRLISSHTWCLARIQMGYRRMPQTELMVLINGRSYIDVRASFNSFLPDGIPDNIGEKLVNAWLDRLVNHPSLHDKVEFEVVNTVLDFSFEETFKERYNDVLDPKEKHIFKELLKNFTNKALDMSLNGSLMMALHRIDVLATRQQTPEAFTMETASPAALVAYISGLLEDCIQDGTIPFSIIARHAFIAESMLRSAIMRGAISPERVSEFKSSFHTIMGELAADTLAVCEGRMSEAEFFDRYGYLRPGTFDIMSPCYRDRSDLFTCCQLSKPQRDPAPFDLSLGEEQNINQLLEEMGFDAIDARGLFKYAKQAIQGREYGKFVFTRNLSECLEAIARWGEFFNMGREDLTHLRIEDILDTCYASTRSDMISLLMHKVDQARMERSYANVVKLSYLIRGVQDIHVVPVQRSAPNFITTKCVESYCKFLKASTLNYGSLTDTLVCIENADPGFDWIFTKGIVGLITKYGGANSHMAIRCAELQLPAAIGCGEDLFERLRNCRIIELNCSAKTIRPLDINE